MCCLLTLSLTAHWTLHKTSLTTGDYDSTLTDHYTRILTTEHTQLAVHTTSDDVMSIGSVTWAMTSQSGQSGRSEYVWRHHVLHGQSTWPLRLFDQQSVMWQPGRSHLVPKWVSSAQMGQIRDFFISYFSTFWRRAPKCTEIWSEKSRICERQTYVNVTWKKYRICPISGQFDPLSVGICHPCRDSLSQVSREVTQLNSLLICDMVSIQPSGF